MTQTKIKYGMVELNTVTGEVFYPESLEPFFSKAVKEAEKSVLLDGSLKSFVMALHYKLAECKGLLNLNPLSVR